MKGILYDVDTICELLDVWKKDPKEVDFAEAFEYIEDIGNSVIDLIDDLGLEQPDPENWVPFIEEVGDEDFQMLSSYTPPSRKRKLNVQGGFEKLKVDVGRPGHSQFF